MNEEQRLIQRIRAGDIQALAELMEVFRGQLLVTASRKMSVLLKRSVEPEDVVQETITYCLKTFPEFDNTSIEPMAWINQVLDRRIIDAQRHFAAQKRSADKGVSLDGNSEEGPGLIELE